MRCQVLYFNLLRNVNIKFCKNFLKTLDKFLKCDIIVSFKVKNKEGILYPLCINFVY